VALAAEPFCILPRSHRNRVVTHHLISVAITVPRVAVMVPRLKISPNDMRLRRDLDGTRMVQPGVMSFEERMRDTVPFMFTANTRLVLARCP